jgi:D-alanyl-D-alanine dipeptidase
VRHRIAAGIVTCAALLAPAAADAAPYPTRAQIDSVRDYLAQRAGVVSVGVIDSEGRVRGIRDRRRFVTASVVKAMLLVAYLRGVERQERALTSYERGRLGPMIRVSSNAAATWTYRRVGDARLRRLARRADMDQFSICCSWADARFSARDQAKLFWQLDELTPRRFRRYATGLLRSVVSRQSWGIPGVARPRGFSVRFKGGWRRTGRGRLVHQAAALRYRGTRFSLAVLTDGNPSTAYGIRTIAGVTSRLVRRRPAARTGALGNSRRLRRARLWNVQSLDRDIRVDVRYLTRRNFTGRRLPGYCKPWVLLKPRPARSLALVQRDLERRGLGLEVFDGYRPARASRAMVRWAYRTGREHLVGTYIARRSNHNRGHAVDLTLVRLASGRELDMGRYDTFGRRAHTRNARGRRLRNRMTLVRAMRRRGFANYHREWWHYEHRFRGSRALDIPIGC